MRFWTLLVALFAVSLPLASSVGGKSPRLTTHPLLPGVRSSDLDSSDWPRALHDKLATGFSPLQCGMKVAPASWAEITAAGQISWVRSYRGADGGDRVIVSDSNLRLFDSRGVELWTAPNYGTLVFAGPLRGTEDDYLLFEAGRSLTVVSASSGRTVWSQSFQPDFVTLRVQVADVLPEMPGMEAAVFLNYGEEGALLTFPPDGEPRIVWQKSVVVQGEFNERYDHQCQIELDLSNPDKPIVWNLRRYRCRGFDARTGQQLSTVEYEVGGEHRRNYGPWGLGRSANGELLGLVVAEDVQLHVHGLRLRRDGANELLWQHYYGEVCKDAPGVAVEKLGFADMNGDGGTDVCYSVRDPQRNYQSFVRWRDGTTGVVLGELPDLWGAQLLPPSAPEGRPGLLAYHAPHGETPTQGELALYEITADGPREVQRFRAAKLLGVETGKRPDVLRGNALRAMSSSAGADLASKSDDAPDFLISEKSDAGANVINGYRWNQGAADLAIHLSGPLLSSSELQAILHDASGERTYVVSTIEGVSFLDEAENILHTAEVHSGGTPLVTAADLDQDRRAELLVVQPAGGLSVYSLSNAGEPKKLFEKPYLYKWFDRGPLAYDVDGDGRLEVLTIGATANARLAVTATTATGQQLWQTELDVFADEINACTLNAGQFLEADRAGVAVSITDDRLIREGTYFLDGPTGERRWFKARYVDGTSSMPIRPRGIPTACDFDDDGVEEIGMDLLSYMAFLRGKDGEFAYVRHTHNIRTDDAVGNGHLYNTFCPVFRELADTRPHWMVVGGFGPFGMMGADPRESLWSVDLDYDVPPNIAMIDVDGDARLEVGYSAYNDRTFYCRDAWTGEVEWTLELPYPPNSTVVSADFDGDGKGEFLTGAFCIGTGAQGKGSLRWQAPAPIGWGAIADFDGDGRGEIAAPLAGKVIVLHSVDD